MSTEQKGMLWKGKQQEPEGSRDVGCMVGNTQLRTLGTINILKSRANQDNMTRGQPGY